AQDNAQNDDKPVEYVNYPSDEQAATLDDCYCGDACGCGTTAQEKCQLDDYEIISDVLGSEKQIVKLYSTALCETAEENLRDIIRDNFTEAAADQYKVFSYMQENGMYKTEQATEEKILEAKQQFTPLCRNNCIDNK
ncbi:MAG: spore coat protein, partial [Clostridiales bacterium]|nr:spore coat protein [Clostridiales bacterium]